MEQKTIDIINQCAHGSHEGTMKFPEAVGKLLEVGVTFYHVDFLRAESTYYLSPGESHIVPLPLPDISIGQEFNRQEMAGAVYSSQYEGQTFPEFLIRSLNAGCIGYMAYLDGQRVVYSGWLGDTQVEYFPGSAFHPTS